MENLSVGTVSWGSPKFNKRETVREFASLMC